MLSIIVFICQVFLKTIQFERAENLNRIDCFAPLIKASAGEAVSIHDIKMAAGKVIEVASRSLDSSDKVLKSFKKCKIGIERA